MHTVDQLQVPQDDRAATHGAVRPDAGTAGHAHAPSHGSMGADAHVVTYLYQVVQRDAPLDHRVVQRATVHAGVRTDLHVIIDPHGAELGDLLPAPFIRGETETVCADHHAWVKDAALTHAAALPNEDARPDVAVRPHDRPRLDEGMRSHAGARTHPRARPDDCQGLHAGRRVHLCRAIDHRRRMHSSCKGRAGMGLGPPLGQARIGQVRILADDHAPQVRRLVPVARADDDATRTRAPHLGGVTRMGEKGDGALVSC